MSQHRAFKMVKGVLSGVSVWLYCITHWKLTFCAESAIEVLRSYFRKLSWDGFLLRLFKDVQGF